MRKLMLFAGAVLLMTSIFGQAVFATETSADPYTDDATIEMSLTGELTDSGTVDLSWNTFDGVNFKYYKVVHSTDNPDAVYPTDGYIHYTTDLGSTSYETTTGSLPSSGVNYYRVCSLTTDNRRGCSNTVTINFEGEHDVTAEGEASELTAFQRADGQVELSWTKYMGNDFNGYKVVHSTTDAAPSYPEDGYVKYITGQEELSYIHDAVREGFNYYRICTLTDGGTLCGNTIAVDSEIDLGENVKDPEPVVDPYSDDPEIDLELTATLVDGEVELSWTKHEGGDLKWYKVVNSLDNPTPYYPADGYIKVMSFADDTSWTHEEPLHGLNYYRVCVITTDDMRGCSNVEEVQISGGGDLDFVNYFPDTKDHWANEYVNDLAKEDIVKGIAGEFRPENNVIRVDALKMIMYAFDYMGTDCDASMFPDMKSGDWFCDVATQASKKGFISGDGGYLAPTRNLTRAEAIKIVIEIRGDKMSIVTLAPFTDVNKEDWYAKYALEAKKLGLVNGIDGRFEPNRYITRGEFAKIVSVAMDVPVEEE